MRHSGKEIFCRFRISNQIFNSNYGSRDIERSLDPTLGIFGQNLNFMDEYLENRDMRFSQGVHTHFVLSFSAKKSWGRTDRFPAKVQKVLKNARFRNFWMNQIFFRKSGFVTFLDILKANLMQKIRKI